MQGYENVDLNNSVQLAHKIFAVCSALAIAFGFVCRNTNSDFRSLKKDRSKRELWKIRTNTPSKVQYPTIRYWKVGRDSLERVEVILKEVRDIIPVISNGVKKSNFRQSLLKAISFGIYKSKVKSHWVQEFDVNMTFEEYFKDRVDDQINGYYLKKAAEFQEIVNRGNSISFS